MTLPTSFTASTALEMTAGLKSAVPGAVRGFWREILEIPGGCWEIGGKFFRYLEYAV